MRKRTFVGTINNESCDVKTLVVAENEADALVQVMAKFPNIEYTEEDVTITPFSASQK